MIEEEAYSVQSFLSSLNIKGPLSPKKSFCFFSDSKVYKKNKKKKPKQTKATKQTTNPHQISPCSQHSIKWVSHSLHICVDFNKLVTRRRKH